MSWAGEAESENWMDTGREYTERWHHQMQIRDASARPLLLNPVWMSPLLDISVRALPHAYRSVNAPVGTAMTLVIEGETSHAWTLVRSDHCWQVYEGRGEKSSSATVRISTDAAWRVLYNAPFDPTLIQIDGDESLAAPFLRARSVIV